MLKGGFPLGNVRSQLLFMQKNPRAETVPIGQGSTGHHRNQVQNFARYSSHWILPFSVLRE